MEARLSIFVINFPYFFVMLLQRPRLPHSQCQNYSRSHQRYQPNVVTVNMTSAKLN